MNNPSNSSDANEGGAKAPDAALALPMEASKHLAEASSWAQKLIATVRWPVVISTMNDVMVKAIKKSTRTPHKRVLFASGASVGILAFAPFLAIIAPTLPITFIFTVIGAAVTGLLFTLLPVRGMFTTTEARRLERSWELFENAQEAIEQTAGQMRESGLDGAQIELELGPRRHRALDALLTTLADIEGAQVAKSALENISTASNGHSLDEPKD